MKFNLKLKVYGDQSWRGKCPRETAEQVTFFNQLRKMYPDTYGKIALHIRNEGKRTNTDQLKIEGMVSGAPDIICLDFICEIKRQDHTQSHWQPGQQEYLLIAQDLGAFACVALGYKAALQAFDDYLTVIRQQRQGRTLYYQH